MLVKCPKCGQMMDPANRFCPVCGLEFVHLVCGKEVGIISADLYMRSVMVGLGYAHHASVTTNSSENTGELSQEFTLLRNDEKVLYAFYEMPKPKEEKVPEHKSFKGGHKPAFFKQKNNKK